MELIDKLVRAKVDLVYAIGVRMKDVFESLPNSRKGQWGESVEDLLGALILELKSDDLVLVKGSHGMRMGILVNELLKMER